MKQKQDRKWACSAEASKGEDQTAIEVIFDPLFQRLTDLKVYKVWGLGVVVVYIYISW